jgi:hypothetical protein
MTNPDNLSTEQHDLLMKLVFEQSLCCLLHHPEIWMTYAKFQQQAAGANEARNVYREAIEIIPDVVALRLALAELEEAEGSRDASRSVLRTAFEKIPCAFTFAALQRFMRRTEGMTAARKLFGTTLPTRMDPSKEALGLEVRILEIYYDTSPVFDLNRFTIQFFISILFHRIIYRLCFIFSDTCVFCLNYISKFNSSFFPISYNYASCNI